MKNPFEKFKHRNIAKVATAYAVVGWLMLQMTEIVLPTFNAPQWIAQTIIFVVIMGFPIALLIAWASEVKAGNYEVASNNEETSASFDGNSTLGIPKKVFYGVGTAITATIGLFAFYVSTSLFEVDDFTDRVPDDPSSSRPNTAQNFRGPRFSINLGATGFRALHNTTTDLAISEDGRLLAFLDHAGQNSEIFIKDLLFPDSIRSIGSIGWVQGSGQMFFSEDGEWLHFIDSGRLKRVRIEGGQFQTLSESATPARSTFTAFEDRLIFGDSSDGDLYENILSTGEMKNLDFDKEEGRFYSWPQVLPGFSHLLITTSDNLTTVGSGNIELIELESGSVTTLIRAASNAQYVNSGHIVFMRDAAIWAVPFDLETFTLSGGQVPVIQGVETNSQYGHATFSVSGGGRLVYLSGADGGEVGEQYELRWIRTDGEITNTDVSISSYGHIALSPSQNQAAFTIYSGDGTSDIWVWDLDRGTLGRRTFEGKASRSIWSADGSTLFYRHSDHGLRAVAANGTEQPVTLFETSALLWPQTVSPDGKEIVFNTGQPYSTYKLPLTSSSLEASETAAQILDLAPIIPPWLQATISPDGNFIAYCSNETGQNHVYVRPWPEISKGKWQVSIEPACASSWDQSKNRMYFLGIDKMQQISYTLGDFSEDEKPTLIEFGIPEVFPEINAQNFVNSPNTWRSFDYSAEREEFLTIGRVGSYLDGIEEELLSAQTTLVVVENWFDELASLAPVDAGL